MEWPGEVTLAGRDPLSVCHEVQACMPMHAMHGPCMAHATWEGGPRGLHCQVHASSWWVADLHLCLVQGQAAEARGGRLPVRLPQEVPQISDTATYPFLQSKMSPQPLLDPFQ